MPIHRRASAALAIGLAALCLAGCGGGDGISFLHPHGIVADAQRRWLIDINIVMAIVVVPVFLLVPLCAWRYRRRNTKAAFRPKWEFWWPIEVAVWGIPVLIVAALTALIIVKQSPLDPYKRIPQRGKPLEVEVIALDWKFVFIYPEQGIATVGTLTIPQGRQVRFRLTSDATIQSMMIPALGSQIYAMAGMVTQLHLVADLPGTLMGENTQFNGDHFQDEHFDVKVLQPDDFAGWIARKQTSGIAFDPRAWDTLSERDTLDKAKKDFGVAKPDELAFKNVDAGFFASIVDKYNPGAMHMSEQMSGHGMQ